ncbi:C2 (Calcium CaLB) [Venustampulla echinocandica]|uniref:C2 (Calcium CaLB) n=1 Tax=Venustampulla echinocandica TaxID=2656787 RepID=A0A370TMW8_9HELO|nr:C2 (Calcium CaLB) [Venustampulla echinocandica]RDL36872.1 C2 (Calcium CaLB) [Venustampulla echinocandica]
MSLESSAAELKAQGVVEAAADPNTSVTAEDAEKKIVTESNKAGIEAFTFDPNASPEEKAAQARARIPEGFHHEHKSKAVAIPTDIDDGQPGAYDLPSPTTAGALPPVAPIKDSHGKPLANGHIGVDDYDRWVERTGWPPRFSTDSSSELDEGNMADYQDWLEGKLSDKLFGDWYHNTAVIVFACLSSWFIATLGGGLAWVFFIMAVCGTYYRTSLRRVRRNFRDDINREMSKRRLETDTESLEWMNSFMLKFWPIYQPVLAETIINAVDQVLSVSTPAFLDSLRMKTFTLGSKPPRLEHVKTYPKAEADIVLMDWKFSFTPGDHSDMTSRQVKSQINPKVVLEVRIGKGVVSKGLDVIVEDMAFSGLMRVKIKLQIPFPHVERVEVCFLERPTIDYVCKPLGGDTLGFDINFIPGLETFILEQIHANIGPIMYAPNVFPIEVAKMLSGSPVDQAIGVLAVTLYGAQDLKNPDKFSGSPDPFTALSFNDGATLAQTKVIKQTTNPKWNETKYLLVTSFNDVLTMDIIDFNDYRKHKKLGTARFPLERVQDVTDHENEQLELVANDGKARGLLTADVRFFPVLEGEANGDGKKGPPPESNTGIARFTVEQVKDLDGSKSFIGQLNPYAVLLLNNKEVHVTRKLKRTNNPIWDNGHKELLITDRKNAKLGLVIKDDRDLGTDPILGTYQIKLDDMLGLMEKGQEWYNLAGAKTGRAKLTLQWKPVALSGVGAGTGGYVTPIGVMRFHFINAKDLRNLETLGKSDPYVRVLLSGIEKGRTVTFQNNLNPDWDEVIYVPVHSTRERLTLEVMDQETMGDDRSLGSIQVLASEYVQQAENGEYLVHDEKTRHAAALRIHGKGSPKGTLNYTAAFYPLLNIADPEDEEAAAKKMSSEAGRISIDSTRTAGSKQSMVNGSAGPAASDSSLAKALAEGEMEQDETTETEKLPKIRLTPEELVKYESGLIIFKILDVDLSRDDVRVEVVMDDMAFPSYVSSTIRSRTATLDDIGDCFVRELDFSKITLRLRDKGAKHGGGADDHHTIAKLTGNTLDTLKQCLNNPTILKMKDEEGRTSSVKVSLKYIPVKMQLDPSESINNMGKLRVDVLHASDLPSADRNGYSDPYCKFELNGKDVFKTKVQKKTLHPAWNEFFEVDVPSRTAAKFVCNVYDWDFGDKADFLGSADINLELLDPFKAHEYDLALDGKSGNVKLRLLFRPDYVTRSRQGSSTFSGTFATPGKIVTGVAGAPIKGVGFAAHNVSKGASFLLHGFKSKKKDEEETNGTAPATLMEAEDAAFVAGGSVGGMKRAPAIAPPLIETTAPTTPPGTSAGDNGHSRKKSFGASSIHSTAYGTPGSAPTGTAHFTIISASGYPPSSNVMVYVKQITPKPKTLHKTDHIKSASGTVAFNEKKENFKCACSADTQFQIQVKGHNTFGSDDDLGENLFFVDESGSGQEKQVKAGSGFVVLKSNFVLSAAATENGSVGADSPKSGFRRSLLSKKERDGGRNSRDITPTPVCNEDPETGESDGYRFPSPNDSNSSVKASLKKVLKFRGIMDKDTKWVDKVFLIGDDLHHWPYLDLRNHLEGCGCEQRLAYALAAQIERTRNGLKVGNEEPNHEKSLEMIQKSFPSWDDDDKVKDYLKRLLIFRGVKQGEAKWLTDVSWVGVELNNHDWKNEAYENPMRDWGCGHYLAFVLASDIVEARTQAEEAKKETEVKEEKMKPLETIIQECEREVPTKYNNDDRARVELCVAVVFLRLIFMLGGYFFGSNPLPELTASVSAC